MSYVEKNPIGDVGLRLKTESESWYRKREIERDIAMRRCSLSLKKITDERHMPLCLMCHPNQDVCSNLHPNFPSPVLSISFRI